MKFQSAFALLFIAFAFTSISAQTTGGSSDSANWNFTEIHPDEVANSSLILGLLEFGSVEIIQKAIDGLNITDFEFSAQVFNVSFFQFDENITFYKFTAVLNNSQKVIIDTQYVVRSRANGERDLFSYKFVVDFPDSVIPHDNEGEVGEESMEGGIGEGETENSEIELAVELELAGENEWAEFEFEFPGNGENEQENTEIVVELAIGENSWVDSLGNF